MFVHCCGLSLYSNYHISDEHIVICSAFETRRQQGTHKRHEMAGVVHGGTGDMKGNMKALYVNVVGMTRWQLYC